MSMGMKESADESDFECLRSPAQDQQPKEQHRLSDDKPKITLQQFRTWIILSRGARYVLILSSSVTC